MLFCIVYCFANIATGISIDLPSELHLETVQAVMLLLSDVSRQVLHILLEFLSAIAHHSEVNQVGFGNLLKLPIYISCYCHQSQYLFYRNQNGVINRNYRQTRNTARNYSRCSIRA